MEIFQTIWTALTTENQILINFISFPMLILELVISMLLFTTILNIKVTTKQKIIYIYHTGKSKISCYGGRNRRTGCGVFLQLSGNLCAKGSL